MSGTLTYKDRYLLEIPDIAKRQEDIEENVIIRFINGGLIYQQKILTHTCKDMFLNKNLKAIYELIINYLKENDIQTLNANNLILFIYCKEDLKYIPFIKRISELENEYTHSGDIENWLIWLHKAYEKRLYIACRNNKDFRRIEKELTQYKFKDLECNLFDVAMKYDDDYETKGQSLIKTGYLSIDRLIGGLQGGNYMILAAATGMGKTAMALNLIIKMAKNGKKVLLFSLEMTQEELLNRIIAIETGISSENLRNRSMTYEELQIRAKYLASQDFFTLKDNIVIPAQARFSISNIEEIVQQTNADIVCVDYLGLIQSDIKTNAYEQVSDVSRRLKLLAIETNKPFIVLHQLNRDVKNRSDKHPTLSDIRDSGKIEQDADFIALLYRPAYYDISKDNTVLEFMIAKSRHSGGAGNIANLTFIGRTQRITDIARF